MEAFAAVVTASGAAAIATIQLVGESAQAILADVFRPVGSRRLAFEVGRILLGHVVDGDGTIDQVTIGCEGSDTFAIHCHGNPLIVERIMKLLQGRGVSLLDAESLLVKTLHAAQPTDSIAVEAKLALTKVKSIEGARIIAAQVQGGLSQKVRQWRAEAGSMPTHEIALQARRIVSDSETARPTVSGCTIVLAGPPNTGKSTLLNALAGCEKAIVADTEGTTRDWVSAEIEIGPLAATVVDTAGLSAELAATSDDRIDRAAQTRSIEVLREADLVLLVLDLSRPMASVRANDYSPLPGMRAGTPILTVLNKSDLPTPLDTGSLGADWPESIRISAKQATGLDDLIAAIDRTLGVAHIDPHTPIAFTSRQRRLLERLTGVESPGDVATCVSALLDGPIERCLCALCAGK